LLKIPVLRLNCWSLDWYFSQIPLPNMIYLYTIMDFLNCHHKCLWSQFSGPNMMYLFNSTEWCYIKRTTDNVQRFTNFVTSVSVKGKNGKYDFANTMNYLNLLSLLTSLFDNILLMFFFSTIVWILYNHCFNSNYTLYKNAGFWLISDPIYYFAILILK
jgi:hypothetical protein